MAYKLHIPNCVLQPRHIFHLPPFDRPLRIHIQGPLISIQRLIPKAEWHQDFWTRQIPQPAASGFARVVYRELYKCDSRPQVPGDLVIRNEYCGLTSNQPLPNEGFDYYGVTFDHLVPADDTNPEVLHLQIIELETTEGPYADGINFANDVLLFKVDPLGYMGKKSASCAKMLSKAQRIKGSAEC